MPGILVLAAYLDPSQTRRCEPTPNTTATPFPCASLFSRCLACANTLNPHCICAIDRLATTHHRYNASYKYPVSPGLTAVPLEFQDPLWSVPASARSAPYAGLKVPDRQRLRLTLMFDPAQISRNVLDHPPICLLRPSAALLRIACITPPRLPAAISSS